MLCARCSCLIIACYVVIPHPIQLLSLPSACCCVALPGGPTLRACVCTCTQNLWSGQQQEDLRSLQCRYDTDGSSDAAQAYYDSII
jgi:hypothetical protein